MSLNKTLDRLFDEIRREAKRNPDFADRLDAVLRLHDSRRDVGDEVIESVARDESDSAEADTLPLPAEEVRPKAGKGAARNTSGATPSPPIARRAQDPKAPHL